MDDGQNAFTTRGRRLALIIAAVGLFWIGVTWAGARYGWSANTRLLLDLAALAGFGLAMWQTINLWRARRNDKG